MHWPSIHLPGPESPTTEGCKVSKMHIWWHLWGSQLSPQSTLQNGKATKKWILKVPGLPHKEHQDFEFRGLHPKGGVATGCCSCDCNLTIYPNMLGMKRTSVHELFMISYPLYTFTYTLSTTPIQSSNRSTFSPSFNLGFLAMGQMPPLQ